MVAMKKLSSRSVILVDVLVLIGLVISTILTQTSGDQQNVEKLLNPSKLRMFVDELQDMPKIKAFQIVNGVFKPKSLTIGMFNKKWKFHCDLPPTPVFAYGETKEAASVPGPTIEAMQGIETRVTWHNHLPRKHILPWDPTIPTAQPSDRNGVPTVVHLHGGIEEPASDGNSNAWFTHGFSHVGPLWTQKTYRYRNLQHPGNLWYHDHAMGLTRVNLLAGLIGAYVIRSPEIEDRLGLPAGAEFDRVLVIFDRSFRSDGSIYMNATGNNPSIHPQWQPEYFGDAIIVNGKAWPRLTVKRSRHRFRIINASNARFFRFSLSDQNLRFVHVGSDSAYLTKPVNSNKFLLGPSEIADVVIDFSRSRDKEVILTNDAAYPYPSGDPVNEANGNVMMFEVIDQLDKDKELDTWRIPERLMEYHHSPPDKANLRVLLSSATRVRYVAMYEYASSSDEPTHLYLNGKPYDAEATETPRVGTAEIWEVINLTEDNHPLHIHLGMFVVAKQTELVQVDEFRECMTEKNDAVECHVSKYARGKRVSVPPHERGWKNVFKMKPGFVTKIFVRFSYVHSNQSYPFDATASPGYVYHCHILDHEDNAMMRPLKMVH